MTTDFSQRLRAAMELRGINGKQLSRLTKVSRSSICLYLKGERIPKQNVVLALAKALNVEPTYLLGLTDQMYIPTIKPLNSLLNDPLLQQKQTLISEITEILTYQDVNSLKTILSVVKAMTK